MPDKIGDKVRLQHILEAIGDIKSYTKGANFEDFQANSMMRNACIRQLGIIGEACNRLAEGLKEKNSDVAWKQFIGLRNILIHQYFGVDDKIVWDIIEQDLKKLEEKAKEIISEIK